MTAREAASDLKLLSHPTTLITSCVVTHTASGSAIVSCSRKSQRWLINDSHIPLKALCCLEPF